MIMISKMGTTPPTLPSINLTKDPRALQPGSEEWKQLSRTIREAFEEHGGLLVEYDMIPAELIKKMFTVMPDVFNLPLETKRRNASSTSLISTYVEPGAYLSHYETFGILNSDKAEEARAFTELMWDNGNDEFRETLHSTSTKLLELFKVLLKMIFDSYDAGTHYESQISSIEIQFRLSKYTPLAKDECDLGLTAHTDGTLLTILGENDVPGLEFQSREGEWFTVRPGKGSFIVFVGQALRAWSNGKMHAVRHKVTLNRDTERLTLGSFFMPKQDQIMEAPDELIDSENPPLFRPFKYSEYLEYRHANHAVTDGLNWALLK